jgi:hypothetical protein
MFAPIRQFLFSKPSIKEYPLYCTAEAYTNRSNNELIVEFFIINRSKDDLQRQRLIELLQDFNPDPSTPISPDIMLKFNPETFGGGKLGTLNKEEDFNRGKGYIVPKVNPQKNTVTITINSIVERAIMKVSIPVVDIPDLQDRDIKRTTRGAIPFNFRDYEEGCYSKGIP